MTLTPDTDEIHRLGADEQTTISAQLGQISSDYDNRSRYIGADRLRKMLRDYIEDELNAVRIHAGVYFVHRQHARTLAALRTLTARFPGEPGPPTSRECGMIRSMGKLTVVYLVEDHTDPEPTTYTKYFAHVYLSRDKAKAGVAHWAERGGHGAVRWQEHAPVSYAYPADGERQQQLYKVVPLRVHPDDQPEP